jgi:hypothetical protein
VDPLSRPFFDHFCPTDHFLPARAAPASGVHTRRRLRRQGEEVADYLIHAGKELVDKCEDLYERSGEVVEDATQELSGKYRALHEYSRQLLGEAEAILRRKKNAAIGR